MSSSGEISGSKVYPRDGLDFYVEPPWCVDLLLENEYFFGSVHDPACGSGTIVRRCQDHRLSATGSDIVDRGHHQAECFDFLGPRWYIINYPDNIICNPPFKLADQFIRRALDVASHKVAMLVQAKFLYSQTRHALFTSTPPARIYHLSARPSMPPGEMFLAGKIKASGGKLDYCWVVWSKDHKGPTQTHWLTRGNHGKKEEEKGPKQKRRPRARAEGAGDNHPD